MQKVKFKLISSILSKALDPLGTTDDMWFLGEMCEDESMRKCKKNPSLPNSYQVIRVDKEVVGTNIELHYTYLKSMEEPDVRDPLLGDVKGSLAHVGDTVERVDSGVVIRYCLQGFLRTNVPVTSGSVLKCMEPRN